MLDMTPLELRTEAARCLGMAKASNTPHFRRSLGKIAELYEGLATWTEAELAAGRLSVGTSSEKGLQTTVT